MKNVRSGVRRKLPAAREAVDQFCGELRIGLLAELPPSERFAIELLLREALMNAVVHGAHDERTAQIHCEIRPVAGGMKIRVADGGRGFDWRTCRDRVPVPLGESGHGLHILHRYASRVQFSGIGNQVEITRMFCQGEAS
jgi:anti-sigma regulatory factor (Ser/Thr protein kinase)